MTFDLHNWMELTSFGDPAQERWAAVRARIGGFSPITARNGNLRLIRTSPAARPAGRTPAAPAGGLAALLGLDVGQALANIHACLEMGVAVVDSSVSGLGGCPYAAGATGNVATEDVLYMLTGLGIGIGMDMGRLLTAGVLIDTALERQPASRLGRIPAGTLSFGENPHRAGTQQQARRPQAAGTLCPRSSYAP